MNKEYEAMKQAAKEYVTNALDGHARKIVCLQFPCAIVWAESIESGVNDPMTADTPEYAVIDRESGSIRWTQFADLLSADQRARIESSAAMCAAKCAGLLHYTIGTELR